MDVTKVRIAKAQYVPEQDAYRVEGTRGGYADLRLVGEGKREKWKREYEELKQRLLRESAFIGGIGTLAVWVVGGRLSGTAFGLGALGGLLYLAMLQGSVDSVGKTGFAKYVFGLRFFVPALPFAILARQGKLGKAEVLAVVGGLLCYKVPLLLRTGNEVVDGLAGLEIGKTGMMGTFLGLAARQVKRRKKENEKDVVDDALETKEREKVFVIAGPSGVGKSTLIHRLMEEFPDRFAYSVSHTTREKREGEEHGVDYRFVEREEFDKMVEEGKFIEHATVHNQSYGTSYEAVIEVLKGGKVCILDLDVQGVDIMRKSGLEWDARFVWIAPPSIHALEDRLRARGTETTKTLKRRLDTAIREIAYAATNNVFDLTIINSDLESAYKELRDFVDRIVPLSSQRDD